MPFPFWFFIAAGLTAVPELLSSGKAERVYGWRDGWYLVRIASSSILTTIASHHGSRGAGKSDIDASKWLGEGTAVLLLVEPGGDPTGGSRSVLVHVTGPGEYVAYGRYGAKVKKHQHERIRKALRAVSDRLAGLSLGPTVWESEGWRIEHLVTPEAVQTEARDMGHSLDWYMDTVAESGTLAYRVVDPGHRSVGSFVTDAEGRLLDASGRHGEPLSGKAHMAMARWLGPGSDVPGFA